MEYFEIVVRQIFMLLIYTMVGVIAVRANILDKNGLRFLSRFITRIGLPLLIMTNAISGTTQQDLIRALPLFPLMLLAYPVLYVMGRLLMRLFGQKGDRADILRAGTMFGNIGFMGIPIVTAALPGRGMLYIALFSLVDQTFLWTLGLHTVTPASARKQKKKSGKLPQFINPSTVCIVLAILIIALQIPIPETLLTALTRTGQTATPLSMIYIGGVFMGMDLKKYISQGVLYGSVIMKMIILPLLFFFGMRLIPGLPTEFAITYALVHSMPTLSALAMMAESQNSPEFETGAGLTFVTTLCSIVTIPLICMIIGQVV